MSETTSQDERKVQVIIVPWRVNCNLLLPNEVVAEVLYHLDVVSSGNDTDWINGEVMWHDRSIPIVNFDSIAELPPQVSNETRRVLICRTASYSNSHEYIAIDYYRLPRLMIIRESNLEITEEGRDDNEWPFLAKVNILETETFVLDIDKLCRML